MISLQNDSSFTVFVDFSLSEVDLKLLNLAYSPIIQSDGLQLYFSMYYNENYRNNGTIRFGNELSQTINLDLSKINIARKKLEGIGLLETYRKEDENGIDFRFVLHAPLKPHKFFSNLSLQMILISRVGEKNYELLKNSFNDIDCDLKGYNSISSSLYEIYSNAGIGLDVGYDLFNDDKSDEFIHKDFDKDELDKELENYNLTKAVLKKDYDKVISLASVSGLTAKTIASFINDSINTKNLFSFPTFEKYINEKCKNSSNNIDYGYRGNIDLENQKLKLMDSLPPYEYIKNKMNLKKVPSSLSNLLMDIKENFGYSNGVINAILDYCIKHDSNGGFPSDTYIEKIAVSLSPNKPNSAFDAQELLNSKEYYAKQKKKGNLGKKKNKTMENNEDVNDLSSDDLKKIMES